MNAEIRLVQAVSGTLVVLEYTDMSCGPDQAMWTQRKLRKPKRCAVTGRTMEKGEYAFGPVGNQMYRAKRLSPEAISDAIGLATS